ncbi:OmpP1/FadL family transporter [Sungkyunkwania multivorans]|uniref:OmpP1/FadL family transporter n=1 Tax=Sungkyunkwania multivorans TaxID=1173618 RepID=A0ABW3D0T4_9FLAO
MRKALVKCTFLLATAMTFAQAGHIMQGVGSVNMSMGGAATAQPLDISGALQWNPATISSFDGTILKLDAGFFFSSPELSATVPEFDNTGQPTGNFFSGTTKDDRGVSILPALSLVWGKEESNHTFGASAFGISGFGVTFPENMSNPINAPQSMGGFGRIESDYALLQVGFTWAYKVSDKFSIGVAPTFNYASLELIPNPTANPNQSGYPTTDKASALGFGTQFGAFFDSGSGIKAGVSYKTKQSFSDFELENTYLDNSTSTNDFNIEYPAILSLGMGYSKGNFDLAIDYRTVFYENANGFSTTGWTQTASVAGFGWKNISILSAGLQFKGIDKLPLRLGYTYSTNPIDEEVTFFNIPATAIIENAFQLGVSYEVNDRFSLDGVFHYGMSNGSTTGPVLNPAFIQNSPPYGAIPGSSVSYDMTTSMIMVGITYNFAKEGDK